MKLERFQVVNENYNHGGCIRPHYLIGEVKMLHYNNYLGSVLPYRQIFTFPKHCLKCDRGLMAHLFIQIVVLFLIGVEQFFYNTHYIQLV